MESGSPYTSWNVVLATTLVIALTAGVATSAIPSLDPAITAEHTKAWSTVLQLKALLTFVVGGLFAVLVGLVVDRSGPRIVLVLGSALTTAACIAYAKLLVAPVSLYLTHVALGIAIACAGPVAAAVTTDQWFDRHPEHGARPGRGIALALGLSAPGLGALIITPLVGWCLSYLTWQHTAWYLALVPFATLALVALLIPSRPMTPPATRLPRSVLTDSWFLVLGAATGVSSFCFFGLTSHASGLGQQLDNARASLGAVLFALPLIALGSKVISGLLSDFGHARKTLIGAQIALTIGPAASTFDHPFWLLWVTVAWSVFGLTSTFLVLDFAPAGSKGLAVGALVAMQVGGAGLGLWLLGDIRAMTGYYQPALVFMTVLSTATTLVIIRSRRLALLSRPQAL